jgi:tetratricopeptide (TPR) repeat protein
LARLLERLRNSTPHEILGVPDDAPLPTLQLAFEKRAFERHPDHLGANQGEGLRSLAIEALTLTTEAYTALVRAGEPVVEEELPAQQAAETVEIGAGLATDAADDGTGDVETDINDRVQRIIVAERHHQKGLELIEAGRFRAAARVLARAVSACDEEGDFRASLAWATFQDGLDQQAATQALEHLDEAILTSPSARAHLFRGYVLNFLERPDEAVWAFQEALRRDPDNEVAQCELERVREERSEDKE